MHIISVTDFPLFCLNSARKCLILPAECSPQNSARNSEFIQAYSECFLIISLSVPIIKLVNKPEEFPTEVSC